LLLARVAGFQVASSHGTNGRRWLPPGAWLAPSAGTVWHHGKLISENLTGSTLDRAKKTVVLRAPALQRKPTTTTGRLRCTTGVATSITGSSYIAI